MRVYIDDSVQAMGQRAAAKAAACIRDALAARDAAYIILATGASQFEVLAALVKEPDIAWGKVSVFHLDEYAGLPMPHPASFRGYLKARFADVVPTPLRAFHYISGEGELEAECARLAALIEGAAIDVACIGIGENAHIAFNDPPADFGTEKPYIVVQLDEACRRQQLGEGWFPTFEDVPREAISMSVRQILKSAVLVCSVPDARKADAVRKSLEGAVTPEAPASILQEHGDCHLYLDTAAASRLERRHDG